MTLTESDLELLASYGIQYPWMPQQTLELIRRIEHLVLISDERCEDSHTVRAGVDLPWHAGLHANGYWYIKANAGTDREYTMIRACLTHDQALRIVGQQDGVTHD